MNTKLFQLSLRGLGILNYDNDLVSGEANLINNILPKILRTDKPVIFDVGANYGNYSVHLLNRIPNASIHAFEPHPKSYSIMKSKVPDKIKTHNIALGESPGTFTLFDRADISGSEHATFYEGVISEIHKQDLVTFDVTVETIDSFTATAGIKEIDFLKIDTEGHELAVLKGSSNLLDKKAIKLIQIEFNEMNIVSRVFFRDIRKILINYNLFRLLPTSLLPLGESPLETELFAYQNILAVLKEIDLTAKN